jgi:cytochrome c1
MVYREVCSACHSLNRIAWRNLVGVSHTVDEARVSLVFPAFYRFIPGVVVGRAS